MSANTKHNLSHRFLVFTVLLLCSIPFGYFISSLAFSLWFIYVLWSGINYKQFYFKKELLPFILFNVWMFCSFFWSQDPPYTITSIGRQLTLFLFPLAGLFIPRINKKTVDKLMIGFALALTFLGLVLIVLALIKYNKYHYKPLLFYHDLVSPLEMNAIYMSYMVSVCFLYLLNLIDKKSVRLIPLLLFLGVYLILLVSKTLILVTALVGAGLIFKRFQPKYTLFTILGSIVAIGLFLRLNDPITKRFLSEANTDFKEILLSDKFSTGRVYTGLEARLLQIRMVSEIIDTPSEFFLGVGLGGSKKQLKEIHKEINTPLAFHNYNFHNQYLQVLCELGLVGFVFFIGLLFVGFRMSYSTKIMIPFILVSLALFFTESVIWRQRGILFFGVLYIITLGLNRYDESKESS